MKSSKEILNFLIGQDLLGSFHMGLSEINRLLTKTAQGAAVTVVSWLWVVLIKVLLYRSLHIIVVVFVAVKAIVNFANNRHGIVLSGL